MKDEEPKRSPWEQASHDALLETNLPSWDSKSRAAHFSQGHRGLLDLELEFPEEHLKGPAPLCYVWKKETKAGFRIHAYVDCRGTCYHLRWHETPDSLAQSQPTHHEGLCDQESCAPCQASEFISNYIAQST